MLFHFSNKIYLLFFLFLFIDVIVSSSNHPILGNANLNSQKPPSNGGIKNINYSTATVTKRRHHAPASISGSLFSNQHGGMNLVDIEIDQSMNDNNPNDNEDSHYNDENIQPLTQSTEPYNDIIDVEVIAKMQEESLRQSVMNLTSNY